MDWTRTILSALSAGAVAGGTAVMAVLTALPPDGTISKTTWTIGIVGALIAAGKDVQASLTPSPAQQASAASTISKTVTVTAPPAP